MELDKESTWPTDVLAYLDRNHALFLGWEDRRGGSGPRTPAAEFDRALDGLRAVLNNHTLLGYHCARLTSDEIGHISAKGMQLPNGAMLRRRIQAVQASRLIEEADAREFLQKSQAEGPNRANRIWFCFFPPFMAGESGIESLLRYWGGEALYNSHDRHPSEVQFCRISAFLVLLKQTFRSRACADLAFSTLNSSNNSWRGGVFRRLNRYSTKTTLYAASRPKIFGASFSFPTRNSSH